MKRFISLIMAILLFSSVILTVSAYSDSEFSNGDVDLDGKLSIRDATDIQKYLAKKLSFTKQEMRLADFNLDGEVNIGDATKIQKVIAKIEDMPTENTSSTPTKEYVTPEEFGLAPDTVDEMRCFQKALDTASELGIPLNLDGKTYYIYTSEARCPIINGSLKIMPSSSLVLTGNKVSLNNVNISRWWDGDGYEYGDVRLHLTDGCVIENCSFSSQTITPSIFCNTEASNTTIRNCTFSEGFGILFNDAVQEKRKYNDVLYTATIGKGLYIDNCTFNTEGKTVEYAGDNIEVNTPYNRFSDVRVTNCTSYGAKEGSFMGIGFGFAQVDNLVCSDNILSNIEGPGAIHMEGCTAVESKNNTVNSSKYGIMCLYTQDAVYDNNTLDNCEYGIYCLSQYPYGYDENICFSNNNILNCTSCPFKGSGLKNSRIISNVFQTDSNYASAVIQLEYSEEYETNDVSIVDNTIEYTGDLTEKYWAYIVGTDFTLLDNKIVGLNSSNFVNNSVPVINIKLNLPANTPESDTLYLASDLNDWNTADNSYAFTRTSKTTAEITLTVNPDRIETPVEFKVTRGSWQTGECNANGEGNVGDYGVLNHTFDIYGSGLYIVNIAGWTDLY